MLLLVLFALLAGAGTALSPCVLPILPVVLSAGVTGGRRRPLGIVTGLTLSFTFAAVALVYLIDALGLPDDIQRVIAIVVLLGFGIALMVPPIGDRIEAWISRIVGAPRMRSGEGFGSGLLLGGALGLAYFPCAGPILAGVITVSAAQDFTVGRLLVAFAYAIGSGGRPLRDSRSSAGGSPTGSRAISARSRWRPEAVMVAAALLMTFNLDVRFQNEIAADLPDFLVNPTSRIEESGCGLGPARQPQRGRAGRSGDRGRWGGGRRGLEAARPRQGSRHRGPGRVLQHRRQARVDRRSNAEGKTVLVDFWTYTCINCIRTLPEVESWYQRYEKDGLVVIGVHTPEFPFERDAGNVADAVERDGLTYPVVQDNDYGTWNAFGNQYWPAKYLIDSKGEVRYVHFGEGDYDQTEDAIRSLLAEDGPVGSRAGPGRRRAGRPEAADARDLPRRRAGPGLDELSRRVAASRQQGLRRSREGPAPERLRLLGELGRLRRERRIARRRAARHDVHRAPRLPRARLPRSGSAASSVLLDGKPISAADAGADVENGVVTVGAQRLYDLVDLPKAGTHTLTLEFDPGIEGYAFTFG